MKKIIKLILVIIILLIIYIVTLSFLNNENKLYLDSISEQLLANYPLEEKITYFNIYGNYYILTTKEEVIVLNKEYEEILKDDIDDLSSNPNNYELIYKNNKLMYEETILKKGKLTYKYYNVNDYEIIKEVNMEKK